MKSYVFALLSAFSFYVSTAYSFEEGSENAGGMERNKVHRVKSKDPIFVPLEEFIHCWNDATANIDTGEVTGEANQKEVYLKCLNSLALKGARKQDRLISSARG